MIIHIQNKETNYLLSGRISWNGTLFGFCGNLPFFPFLMVLNNIEVNLILKLLSWKTPAIHFPKFIQRWKPHYNFLKVFFSKVILIAFLSITTSRQIYYKQIVFSRYWWNQDKFTSLLLLLIASGKNVYRVNLGFYCLDKQLMMWNLYLYFFAEKEIACFYLEFTNKMLKNYEYDCTKKCHLR